MAKGEKFAEVLNPKMQLERRSIIREIVFGTQDGLLVPLGVTAGVAGATARPGVVIVAGLAEAFAGMIAMGVGAYLAGRAEQDLHRAAITREMSHSHTTPEFQREELVRLFREEGLSEVAAVITVDQLSTCPDAFTRTLVEKKLGFAIDRPETPHRDGLIMGVSYLIGACFPILPYATLPVQRAFLASLFLTLIALFSLGVLKGKVTDGRLILSGIEVAAVGAVSGVAGYVLGTFFPHWIGISL